MSAEKRAIFNPLAALASGNAVIENQPQIATAAVKNNDVGVCPKCGTEMIRAVIANNETVFYCEADRVSTPLPDELCGSTI